MKPFKCWMAAWKDGKPYTPLIIGSRPDVVYRVSEEVHGYYTREDSTTNGAIARLERECGILVIPVAVKAIQRVAKK